MRPRVMGVGTHAARLPLYSGARPTGIWVPEFRSRSATDPTTCGSVSTETHVPSLEPGATNSFHVTPSTAPSDRSSQSPSGLMGWTGTEGEHETISREIARAAVYMR